MPRRGKCERADGKSTGKKHSYHRFLKKHKVRLERHAAKRDPETPPAYRKFHGYEM